MVTVPPSNRALVFAPTAQQPFTFDVRSEATPQPKPGEVLIRNLVLSCDPTQFAWLGGMSTYAPPVRAGEVMRAWGAGLVVRSEHPGFAPGDRVWGTLAWQDYSLSNGTGILPLRCVHPDLPLSYPLSITGINGVTAHLGVVEIGQVTRGETVVVSTAAGATGSAAAQIARNLGARVIGIAGGPQKCAWLRDTLQLAGAIDYKAEPLAERLAELCPDGIDFYFDNVGGAMLDAVLARMATGGRIALCGATSLYTGNPAPLHNGMMVLARTLSMRGFMLMNHLQQFDAIAEQLTLEAIRGKLIAQEDISVGLESAPAALLRLLEGKNLGKQLVQLEGAEASDIRLHRP